MDLSNEKHKCTSSSDSTVNHNEEKEEENKVATCKNTSQSKSLGDSDDLNERTKLHHAKSENKLDGIMTCSKSIVDGVEISQVEESSFRDDQTSSTSSISQRDTKTILEEIDAQSTALHKEKTLPPAAKETNDSVSLESSASYLELHQDKENASVLDRVLISPTREKNLNPDLKLDSQSDEEEKINYEQLKNKDQEKGCLNVERKEDPFSLSADEDFSPKTYKPIPRKVCISQERPAAALKRCAPSLDGDNLVDKDNEDSRDLVSVSGSDLLSDSVSERKKVKSSHRVTYVYSAEMVEKTNKLSRIQGRANLVHSLIHVYGILQHIDVIEPRYATEAEILGFHCPDYIGFLKGISDDDDDNSDEVIDEAETFGLSYDCPLQKDCFDIASLISGGTITAAETLCNDKADIAINWCGGWHHAKRDSASGFCYLNDIVLGILKLRERFDKVLYVDIDLHHGDGVEEAFYMTPKVMTVSFHKWAPGFFPGSGELNDIGTGRGKYHSLNIPLKDGMKDGEFYFLFSKVMNLVREKFQPEAVVMQCGADTLSEDPMLSFNVTHIAIAKCVCYILTWNLPTLLLGGGGYHFANTAKCWAFITAMAAGKKLPTDIPEHENLLEYGPSYELTTSQGFRKNLNSHDDIRQILFKVQRNLNQIQAALP